MNNSSHLVQQHEASEALLLCSSNNSSSSSLRQYVTSTHNKWTIIIAVFGITGSTTVRIVRPIVTNVFGVEGSFLEGPWSYRLTYLSITLPLYSIILLGVGTIFRRHNYFKRIVFRMWGRFIPNRLINNNGSGRNNPGGGGVV
ncbi:hypothetical protein RhiirA1_410161 [Rhizophagus irregularis]|uniref:DUF6787 domain-containing protein n=1 Tax=Rhizophagus irregularis TaxID=588596 RepID=A0A2N0SDX0_9GLOM|nr:hypothetical protein RhiirA1_410161 [Rhizophagus irregularis]